MKINESVNLKNLKKKNLKKKNEITYKKTSKLKRADEVVKFSWLESGCR